LRFSPIHLSFQARRDLRIGPIYLRPSSSRLDFGTIEYKPLRLGVTAYVDSSAFPQVTASVLMSAFDPANQTVEAPNPWSAWVSVQVLVFA
jgi:hypothetical protein